MRIMRNVAISHLLLRSILSISDIRTAAFVSDIRRKSDRQGKLTMLTDNFSNTEESSRSIYYFDEIGSTMDTARDLLKENTDKEIFTVVTKKQTNGRGTNNRTWISEHRNLYMTVVVKLPSIPLPLTLVPLRIGTLIAPAIAGYVQSSSRVYLKWPNDVLIDTKKVCGTLIEIDSGRMFIGIGCNVEAAPTVIETGRDGGRQATCIFDHLVSPTRNDSEYLNSIKLNEGIKSANSIPTAQFNINHELSDSNENVSHSLICEELATVIANNISNWLLGGYDSVDSVIKDFEERMDFSPQLLRREYKTVAADTDFRDGVSSNIISANNAACDPSKTSIAACYKSSGSVPNSSEAGAINVTLKGEEVIPLRINRDGTLTVQVKSMRMERVLVADYLW